MTEAENLHLASHFVRLARRAPIGTHSRDSFLAEARRHYTQARNAAFFRRMGA